MNGSSSTGAGGMFQVLTSGPHPRLSRCTGVYQMEKKEADVQALWISLLVGSGIASLASVGGDRPEPARRQATASDSTERARALHALNRLTYGPRPGDVDRVLAMGVERWIEDQLHPDRIDDTALEDHLAGFDVLDVSTEALGEMFRAQQREQRDRQRRMAADTAAGRSVAEQPSMEDMRRRTQQGLPRLNAQYQQVTVTRAVLSERQLYEVLVDFWTNHFNVFRAKGPLRYLTTGYVEGVIRPNALGRFEDLLIATAQSPAMLVYLDNAQSVASGAEPPQLAEAERRIARQRMRMTAGGMRGSGRNRAEQQMRQAEERIRRARERMPSGLNENYARELLELHTLGVDGGYTQDDVVGVARLFTGWSVDQGPRRAAARFVFNEWAHDDGPKDVLGQHFPAGGDMDEAMRLLRFLARHPSTMRHVSAKLCVRLVSDTPPAGCIDAGVQAWEASDGDIRAVVGAIVAAPSFWAAEHRLTKTKTPLEFVVSAVRALGATPDYTPRLARTVAGLGQPLYLYQPPTGYPETQESWVNSGALLNRLNMALGFASGRFPGARFEAGAIALNQDLDEMVAQVNQAILNGTGSPNTLRIMREQAALASGPEGARATLVGYALGSPEFQRQ